MPLATRHARDRYIPVAEAPPLIGTQSPTIYFSLTISQGGSHQTALF